MKSSPANHLLKINRKDSGNLSQTSNSKEMTEKYLIIPLSELDRIIKRVEDAQAKFSAAHPDWDYSNGQLAGMKEIKFVASKYPDAQQVFERGMFIQRRGVGYGEERLLTAEDFINQYIQSK